jgi:hypothetical protein
MTMTEADGLGSITTDDALILRDEFKEADAEAVNERMRSLSPEEQARLLVLQGNSKSTRLWKTTANGCAKARDNSLQCTSPGAMVARREDC